MRGLLADHERSLGVAPCLARFRTELATLEQRYAPPEGAILIAARGDRIVGCVGLRQSGAGVAEVKRLYVVPAERGRRIGRALVRAVRRAALKTGYRRLVLDTLETKVEARSLYAAEGFAPFGCPGPAAGILLLGLELPTDSGA